MARKSLYRLVLVFCLTTILLTPIESSPIQARVETLDLPKIWPGELALQAPLTDQDGDGIASAVESAGWSNGAGGPYVTDHLNPDSDADGLSDGEEQLYNTNPLSESSPGLYVEYQPAYQTRKFYPWKQYGNKFITHGAVMPANIRDVIVRRGATLTIGGPPGATLDINPEGSLTPLSAVPNSCGGGWTIAIPSDAKAGKYTLTAQKDNWTSSLTLYVIFDLKGDNQNEIDVMGYNERDEGHANAHKDEIAIYFDTTYEVYSATYDPDNHDVYGWGIGWETSYTSQRVFEDYVMPAIKGISDRAAAANALGHKVDETLTIDWFKFPNSTDAALNLQASDCTGHASLLTTFLRSAGITSRPMVVEWKNAHYDTSTEVWTGNTWEVMRPYKNSEYAGSGDPPSPPLVGGIITLRSRSSWGSNQYSIDASDMLLVAGSNWQWDQININYAGSKYRDWLTHRPGQFDTIKRWNWVQTPLQEYWGINPPTVIADCSTCGQAPMGVSSLEVSAETGTPHRTTQPHLAHLNRIVADRGVDLDGDGRFDQLVIDVELDVTQPGVYTLGGVLNDTDPQTRLGREMDGITGAQVFLPLEAGVQTIQLAFGGRSIRDKAVAGPYLVDQLWLTPLQNPSPQEIMDNLVDYQNPYYLTGPYSLDQFENGGASLTHNYTHQALDQNGDGLVDNLMVTSQLDLITPGSYWVEAELADSAGQVVATAEWSGSGDTVTLEFDALLGDVAPYWVQNVHLFDSAGRLIDSDAENYIGFSPANPSPVDLPGVPAGSTDQQFFLPLILKGETSTPSLPSAPTPSAQPDDASAARPYSTGPLYGSVPGAFSVQAAPLQTTALDPNGDGKFDELRFTLQTTLPVPGSYRLQGWLQNSQGKLIAWETSNPANLAAGVQTLSLAFAGERIKAQGVAGPYQLVALKLLLGPNNLVVDEWTVAAETPAYRLADFAGDVSSGSFNLNTLTTCSTFITSSPDTLGETTVFTSTSSGDNLSFEWNFGDGSPTAAGPTATHTYAMAGAYIVSLTTNDGVDSHTAMATVVIENPLPVAAFSSSSPDTLGQTTQFTNLSGGSNLSFAWDFGDGSVSTAVHPTHTYAAAGNFTVVLTASNSAGTDVTAQTVQIDSPPTPGQPFYLSLASGASTVGAVTSVKDEDILYFDGFNYSFIFDGSDVGVGGLDLDAFEFVNSNTILMSFNNAATIGSLGTVADADIVQFNATGLGSKTTGSFSWYLDGSDVGLDTSAEDIDAIDLLPDGRILISTVGNPSVPGVSGKDEDILAFTPATLGATTAGSWAMYFDGSDVGLSTSSTEDVSGLTITGDGALYLSTLGAFAVTGVSGTGEDVFICTPTSLGNTTACNFSPTLLFDGSARGVAGNLVDGISLPN